MPKSNANKVAECCGHLNPPQGFNADFQRDGAVSWAYMHNGTPFSCFLAKTASGFMLTVREQESYPGSPDPGWVMLLRNNATPKEAGRRFLQFLVGHWLGIVLSVGEDPSIPLPSDNAGGVVLSRRIPEDTLSVVRALDDAERMFALAMFLPSLEGDGVLDAVTRSIARGSLVVVPEQTFRGAVQAVCLNDRVLCVLEERRTGGVVSFTVQEAPEETGRPRCCAGIFERSYEQGHGWWIGPDQGEANISQATALRRLRSICKGSSLKRQGSEWQFVRKSCSN